MSDELVIPASRGKAVLLLLASMAFVALGVWLKNEEPLYGWLCIVFFALGIPVSVMMMMPGTMYLRLDSVGFEMHSPFYKKRIPWSAVDRFEMGSIRNTKMIGIVYSREYKDQKTVREMSSSIAGIEGGIPNTYTMPLQEVLSALNQWHARFAKQSVPMSRP